MISQVRLDSPRQKSAPLRAGNRKLSLSFSKGLRIGTLFLPTALLIRGAQGDSSRYSLLMGVLFSGALSSLETCHASLASPRISRRTTLDTDNAVRMSKISPEVRESHVCVSIYVRLSCAFSRTWNAREGSPMRASVWVSMWWHFCQEGEERADARAPRSTSISR